ncbi:hypothetical protein [Streptomyces sp. AC495_CC817]|uniref:hypothetical protein n=1 Tax=Streptomyces sp. AC495_CC817 TaxID=2823900 RepID=UPI001C26B089|nr:hypothetical protein [Streptomyces sp. AC495_CC817]
MNIVKELAALIETERNRPTDDTGHGLRVLNEARDALIKAEVGASRLRAAIDGPHPANSDLDSFTLAHVSHFLDMAEISSAQWEPLAVARNIINQIGDIYHERIPSPDWVKTRQETNDELDTFVASLIRNAIEAESAQHGLDPHEARFTVEFDPDAWASLDRDGRAQWVAEAEDALNQVVYINRTEAQL